MKFFRNFLYYPFFYAVYDKIGQINLEALDRLPFDAMYYSVKLKELSADKKSMEGIYTYLDEEASTFAQLGTYIVIPWLGLLYNLKRLRDVGLYHTAVDLDAYIDRLERYCDTGTSEEIRAKILGGDGRTKERFVRDLMNVFETRDTADMANVISNLTVPANILIRESLADGDTEAIFLCSLVLSDQTFVYSETASNEMEPMIKGKDITLEDRLQHYQQYLLSAISLMPGQLLVWIFNYDEVEACLFIDANKHVSVSLIKTPIRRDLRGWTENISGFYFNAKELSSAEYDFTAQEADYARTLAFFAKASIPYPGKYSELLVCCSTELATMPHNLLVGDKDFIASGKPVANVISLEYFARHNAPVTIPVPFQVEAWIPTDDGNLQIAWGHALLEEDLAKFHSSVQTKRYPDGPLHGDINIFLAHGIRESAGFKFVQSGNDAETSIIYPSHIFGSGIIAILFICNSGSSEDDLYANQIVSFSADLLKSGYRAVISSFWPYDVTMSRRWFTVFMETMVAGSSINQAVWTANNRLADYDKTTSQAYYAPAGRFAMHLYGNPNITIGAATGG